MGGAGAVPHSITRGQNGAGPLFDEVAALSAAGGKGYAVGFRSHMRWNRL